MQCFIVYYYPDLLQLADNYSQSKENIKEHIIQVKFSRNEKNRINTKQIDHAQVNYSLKEFCLR